MRGTQSSADAAPRIVNPARCQAEKSGLYSIFTSNGESIANVTAQNNKVAGITLSKPCRTKPLLTGSIQQVRFRTTRRLSTNILYHPSGDLKANEAPAGVCISASLGELPVREVPGTSKCSFAYLPERSSQPAFNKDAPRR
jgi:hypothetical protein